MRVEGLVLLAMAAFGTVVGIVYWFTAYDPGGTVMLIAFGLLGLLPGGYYYWWSRRMQPRPEDRPEANPQDSAGVVAAFPGSSIWPFVLGTGCAFIALALVFGPWTALFGLALVVSSLVGVIVESRRGGAY